MGKQKPTYDLSGKVALITGGAGGQGLATARTLADCGADIVLADIDVEGNEKAVEAVCANGGKAVAVEADVRSEEQVEKMVAAAVKEFGRLDILHNNAADLAILFDRDPAMTDFTVEAWHEEFETIVLGAMLGCKYAIPAMVESGAGGSIICTTSASSVMGELNLSIYAAAKAAVNQVVRSVSTQYGKKGIRCNAIAPGPVLSAPTLAMGDEMIKTFIEHCDTTYVGQPQDIANIVAFLASDASRYITSHVLVADGGLSEHSPMTAEGRASGIMVGGGQSAP